MADIAQQLPHTPSAFTGVTTPLVRQSIEVAFVSGRRTTPLASAVVLLLPPLLLKPPAPTLAFHSVAVRSAYTLSPIRYVVSPRSCLALCALMTTQHVGGGGGGGCCASSFHEHNRYTHGAWRAPPHEESGRKRVGGECTRNMQLSVERAACGVMAWWSYNSTNNRKNTIKIPIQYIQYSFGWRIECRHISSRPH